MPATIGQEYKITEATIFADRFDEEYNITKYVGELSFFEDIERPYVTAQLVCMDDLGVFDEIKVRGSEQIRFTIESVEESLPDLSFTIVLNLVSIIMTDKVGDRSEIYHINLISPHAYRDANIKISRSYTGKLELISEAILKNHLDVDVDISYVGAYTSLQAPVKVLIPYISPLESVEWLLDRATTLIGSPFYAWQTIYDQKEGKDTVRFGNLETMMNAPTYNEELPLTYSAATAASVADGDLSSQGVTVKTIRVENIQDTLKMMHEGHIGSSITSVDTYTSDLHSRRYSIKEHLDRLEKMNVIPYGANQNIYDAEQQLTFGSETKAPHEWNSREFSMLTSYGTYGSTNSYHDINDASDAVNKIRAPAVKSMFNKNMFDIVIPGISFFAQLGNGNSGVSVGDTVMIDFLNSNTDDDQGGVYNQELSGKYLIHRCRNIFKDTTHEIVVSISKLASKGARTV
tara:strand:+ start:2889 stop:4268 length:1380 start_codon:yes stop_codon:yes gene_type:complete